MNTRIKKYVAVGNAYGNFWAMGSFHTLKEAVEWVSLYHDSDREPEYRNVNGTRECEIGNDWIGKNESAKWNYDMVDGIDFEDNIRLADKLIAEGRWHATIHEAQFDVDEYGEETRKSVCR